MKVFYFVKVGKSDLVIHVTIVMAKKSSTKSISVFSMPKKIRQWQTCSNVYHSLQNATQTKLLKLANMKL